VKEIFSLFHALWWFKYIRFARHIPRILFIVLTAYLLPGCVTIVPVSAPVLPTGFTNKNELSASGLMGIYGISTNVAYSPIKHFYLQGSWTFSAYSTSLSSYQNSYYGGVGIYFPLGSNFSFEGQVSVGTGINNKSKFVNWNGYTSINFLKSGRVSGGFAFRYEMANIHYDSYSSKIPYLSLIGYHRTKISDLFNFIGSYGITIYKEKRIRKSMVK